MISVSLTGMCAHSSVRHPSVRMGTCHFLRSGQTAREVSTSSDRSVTQAEITPVMLRRASSPLSPWLQARGSGCAAQAAATARSAHPKPLDCAVAPTGRGSPRRTRRPARNPARERAPPPDEELALTREQLQARDQVPASPGRTRDCRAIWARRSASDAQLADAESWPRRPRGSDEGPLRTDEACRPAVPQSRTTHGAGRRNRRQAARTPRRPPPSCATRVEAGAPAHHPEPRGGGAGTA